jgi:hypothetical protein
MRIKQISAWTILLAFISCGRGLGGEGGAGDEPSSGHFLHRLRPEGGWNPYGGGVLHWWKRDCFPCYTAPDDYCRKPLPRVCWPKYPEYYTWGPPEIVHPPNHGF